MESKKIYDIIIVGGGPAGSTAASNLAKKGFDVLVLEKEKFPRFHIGESLLPFCYQVFEELGVREQMEKEFVRKPGATFSNTDNSEYSHWCFDKVINDPSYLSFHVRRERFDQILLENSREKGATVIEEARVTQVDMEVEDLVLVEAKIKKSKTQKFTGKFLIDASGQSSLMGKKMGTRQRRSSINPRIAYYSHWENVQHDEPLDNGTIRIVMLEGEKKGWIWMFYIGDNQLSAGVVVDMDYAKKKREESSGIDQKDWAKEFYLEELSSSPFANEIVNGAQMLREVSVTSDYSYNVDQKYGDKYALIGDASAFLDPIFSSGVFLAIKSAMLLTDALAEKHETGNDQIIKTTYDNLEKGYQLVEKMITTFYDANAAKFSEANPSQIKDYDRYESAFSIMHLILAGDFFKSHEKYSKSIDILTDKKSMSRFRHLTDHSEESILDYCRENG